MKREFPVQHTVAHVRELAEWFVAKYDLPCTAAQFIHAHEDGSHIVAAANLLFAELQKMDARITVDARFKFEVDITALVKLDQVLTFYRNSNPATKDADVEQLSILVKTTMAKVREYDSALRGISISSTRSELEPESETAIEDTSSPADRLPGAQAPTSPPSNPAAPPQGIPPQIGGAPRMTNVPPGTRAPGAPPPNVLQTPSRPAPDADLSESVRPPESSVPVPGNAPPDVSEDDAIRAMAPPDSGARLPGTPPRTPQNAPPGGPPSPGGFAPPPGAPSQGAAPAAPGAPPGASQPPSRVTQESPSNENAPPSAPPSQPPAAPGTPPPPPPEF